MVKDRPNKIPRPRTIARHYAEGKYCDYPADIIFEAVNSYDYDYNPTAIPIRIGFRQTFVADFAAFEYMCDHRDEDSIRSFLKDPNGYMNDKGISLRVPLDEITSKVMVAMLDDEILKELRNSEGGGVCRLVYSIDKESWRYRHPERYDRTFMKREISSGLDDLPLFFDEDYLESKGFNRKLGVDLYFIGEFFAE